MRYGSLGFVATLGALALAACTLAVERESVELGWAAAAIAAYALHLLALRSVARAARVRGAADAEAALVAEREALERREREIAARRTQVEEQWTLLREMIQERIRRRQVSAAPLPDAEGGMEREADTTTRAADARSDEVASQRVYSRW